MRLVSYNILNGGVGRADPVGEVIEAQRADVVVLIEADDDWVATRIARRLGMDLVIGRGEKHAAAVLSRFPIASSTNHAGLNSAGPRSWLEAQIQPPGQSPILVHAIHLSPRATLADEHLRVGQLRQVLSETKPFRDAGVPHVLAGDFNANAPQQQIDIARCKKSTRAAFVENGSVIPRDAVGLLLQNGYVDTLHATLGDAAMRQATFTTHEPGQRVDYVFTHGISARQAWIETDRLATYASDHYPVAVELNSGASTKATP